MYKMTHTPTKNKLLLGKMLVDKNIITEDQLILALSEQQKLGLLLGTVLVKMGFVNHENDLLPIIAEQQGIHYVSLHRVHIPKEVINRVPLKIAKLFHLIPIAYDQKMLTLAINRPLDLLHKDEIEMICNCEIMVVLASYTDIDDAINRNYGLGADTIADIMNNENVAKNQVEVVQDLEKVEAESTIANYLNQIFLEAYKRRATDIHIEPFENELMVRYRIDGILYDVNAPKNLHFFKDSLCSRIKILSNLDISERRRPQDGRFRLRIGDVQIDFRVSVIPMAHGEGIVLRILNATRLYSFEELNLSKKQHDYLNDLIRRPHGIIFITGPTGSGKTTTLYSCLNKMNTIDKKIITIEDPVEYRIHGINQIQINPEINLTFAKGLRSILRHDPNIIMIGEVRDVETAEIAIQVALTGHLVLSTIHTNDAASGATRLINMGIEPYLITSTVECFIAQRLVRVICPKCKVERKLSAEFVQRFDPHQKKDLVVHQGKGCDSCGHTGYFGRTGIFEFLMMDDDIRDLILNRVSATQLKAKAIENGMQSLRDNGWEKVLAGITTPEEVLRVSQERSRRK